MQAAYQQTRPQGTAHPQARQGRALWTLAAPAIALCAVAALGVWLAFRRYEALYTGLFDLGYYTQVIWNTAQGRWFATSLRPASFLADHFSPILALLAPLFWLFPVWRLRDPERLRGATAGQDLRIHRQNTGRQKWTRSTNASWLSAAARAGSSTCSAAPGLIGG